MQPSVGTSTVSKGALWTGRILIALVFLFMLFDGGIKVLRLAPAVEVTIRLGYPASVVVPIGVVALVSALIYAIPSTFLELCC